MPVMKKEGQIKSVSSLLWELRAKGKEHLYFNGSCEHLSFL